MTFSQPQLPLEPAAPQPPEGTTEAKGMVLAPPKTVDPLLVKILGWKRPFESKGEIAFMTWLHAQIKSYGHDYKIMASGCVAVTVPRSDGKASLTLFSCHTDTVHHQDGPTQGIVYDPDFGHIFLDKDDPNAGSCLGADDGAGVWLMLRMIEQKVPGTYLFHRGEERGAVGARDMLAKHKEWLEQFEIAVAFDRPNNYEVITHQGGQQCCSDKFAKALAAQLSTDSLAYSPSAKGVFTDTKIYRNVIAECTNIGVGYYNQHSKDETLDYAHLCDLLDAVLDVNWDALPVDRDPTAVAVPTWSHGQYPYYDRARATPPGGKPAALHQTALGFPQLDDLEPDDEPVGADAKFGSTPDLTTVEELDNMTSDDMWTLCNEDPESAYRVVVDLYTEVKALESKLGILRNLLGLT